MPHANIKKDSICPIDKFKNTKPIPKSGSLKNSQTNLAKV